MKVQLIIFKLVIVFGIWFWYGLSFRFPISSKNLITSKQIINKKRTLKRYSSHINGDNIDSSIKYSPEVNSISDDDVFGSELKILESNGNLDYEIRNGKKYYKITSDQREKSIKSFYKLRLQLLNDNLFVVFIGLCIIWSFGTLKDVYSFGFGGALGIIYSVLLGRYVEGIGNGGNATGGGGSARFAPVILLIVFYGKFRDQLSIFPELAGFFSYKIAPILQIFNEESLSEEE